MKKKDKEMKHLKIYAFLLSDVYTVFLVLRLIFGVDDRFAASLILGFALFVVDCLRNGLTLFLLDRDTLSFGNFVKNDTLRM